MKNKKLIHVFFLAIVISSCSINKDLKFNRDIINKINNTQKKSNDATLISSNIHFKKNYYNNFVNKLRTPSFFLFRNTFAQADTIYIYEQISTHNNYVYGYILNENFEGITYQYKSNLEGWTNEVKVSGKIDDHFLKYKNIYSDLNLFKESVSTKSMVMDGDILVFGRIILNFKNPKKSKKIVFQKEEWIEVHEKL